MGLLGTLLLLIIGRPAVNSEDPKPSNQTRPPDLVGRIEGVSTVKRQDVINGVEKATVETRMSLVVQDGSGAARGSRVTVRMADTTRSGGAVAPALGDVVRVWIAPGTVD